MEKTANNQKRKVVYTRWLDSVATEGLTPSIDAVELGTCLVEALAVCVPCPPSQAFKPIQRIGGETGWYYANWLWRLRAFLDMLVGGVGLRRTRPDRETLALGDIVDCWRVAAFQPDRLLRLSAEMRVPGRAWLQFEVVGDEARSTIRQTAIFDPRGILGLIYWLALYPIHRLMFVGMLRGIVKAIGDSP